MFENTCQSKAMAGHRTDFGVAVGWLVALKRRKVHKVSDVGNTGPKGKVPAPQTNLASSASSSNSLIQSYLGT